MNREDDAALNGNRRRALLLLAACGAAALVIFLLVLSASIHKTPGFSGILNGIFGGLFAALLVGVMGAWIVMSLVSVKAAPEVEAQSADQLMSELSPVLAELEATRVAVVREVNARAMTRVPLGAAAGFGIWCLEQLGSRSARNGVDGAIALVAIGMLAGYVFASNARSVAYSRLYLGRILPLLAAHFGDLSFRSPARIDVQALNAESFFDDYDSASADNEFFGTHRGLPISISTLRLTVGSGKQRRVSFEGLLVEVTLPRGLKGVTTVISGTGAFQQLRHWLKTSNRQRVALEDPRFSAVYEVWSTDQIAARALLTPALMERLLAFSGTAKNIDGRPLVMARDNRLTLVVPRYGRDYFLAPGFRQAAASQTALSALYQHIAGVLAVTDAVIDLDQAARTVAAASDSISSADA